GFSAAEIVGKDIDQFHNPIGVGSRGRNEEASLDRARDAYVLCEHRPLVYQHVRPTRGDSLILDHVIASHSKFDLIDVFHRAIRVAYVLVKRAVARVGGRFEREAAVLLKIERTAPEVARRPLVIFLPLVRAGLEYPGLGKAR